VEDGMKRFAAFVHRTLWSRHPAYRWAALLGPPPALGVVLAFGVLAVLHGFQAGIPGPDRNAPWAHWTRPPNRDAQPFAEATAPLPQSDASGRYVGFEPGWHGVIQPLSVDATMSTTVTGTILARFALSQPTVPLARIVEAGPASGLFVGTVSASFVVQAPGVYAFSARLTRSADQPENCLLWLETSAHRMFRNVNISLSGQGVLTYGTTEYRLEPGLLHLVLATGCWQGQSMNGNGEVTVLVRHPGQAEFQAVAADELISPVRQGSSRQ
jgi:hypothetical protein